MARHIKITVSEKVAKWLDANSHEASKSELIQEALAAYYNLDHKGPCRDGGIDQAKALIRDLLKRNGGEVETDLIKKQAEQMGISQATLRRAKILMKIRSFKRGFGAESKWYWKSPA